MTSVLSAERNVVYAVRPFLGEAALHNEKDVVDDLLERCGEVNGEDTRQPIATLDPLIRVVRYRRNVMREENAILCSSPLEDGSVIHPVETCLLNGDEVDLGCTTPNRADNVGVEVLVRRELQHELAASTGEQSCPDSSLRRAFLVFGTHSGVHFRALCQVSRDLIRMLQDPCDYRIGSRQ